MSYVLINPKPIHRLKVGWSCKSYNFQTLNQKKDSIDDDEKKIIFDVLERAQQTEQMENVRIK